MKMNVDAVALIGYVHIDLSHRRWDLIKPHLNKDYAGLCASHVPVTALLFGNDLQTQLNNIWTSNKISSTAVGNRYKNTTYNGHPSRNYQKNYRRSKPFNPRAVSGSYPKNSPSDNRTRGTAVISADILDNLQVNNLALLGPMIKRYFADKVLSFEGGQLAHFLDKWMEITSDSEVLNCVKGQYIEFSSQPTKNLGPRGKTFNISDPLVIRAEIHKLLEKGVIVPTQYECGEYISPIFVAMKMDGS